MTTTKIAFVNETGRREYAFDHACLDKSKYYPGANKKEKGFFICKRDGKECLINNECPIKR